MSPPNTTQDDSVFRKLEKDIKEHFLKKDLPQKFKPSIKIGLGQKTGSSITPAGIKKMDAIAKDSANTVLAKSGFSKKDVNVKTGVFERNGGPVFKVEVQPPIDIGPELSLKTGEFKTVAIGRNNPPPIDEGTLEHEETIENVKFRIIKLKTIFFKKRGETAHVEIKRIIPEIFGTIPPPGSRGKVKHFTVVSIDLYIQFQLPDTTLIDPILEFDESKYASKFFYGFRTEKGVKRHEEVHLNQYKKAAIEIIKIFKKDANRQGAQVGISLDKLVKRREVIIQGVKSEFSLRFGDAPGIPKKELEKEATDEEFKVMKNLFNEKVKKQFRRISKEDSKLLQQALEKAGVPQRTSKDKKANTVMLVYDVQKILYPSQKVKHTGLLDEETKTKLKDFLSR